MTIGSSVQQAAAARSRGRARSAPRTARISSRFSSSILTIALLVAAMGSGTVAAAGFGVNWGNLASHRLPGEVVLRMLKASNISRLKLFDADSKIVGMFAKSDVELMVGIPNEMLAKIAATPRAALDWVKDNVTVHLPDVKIRYVAVGNEPFLEAYNQTYQSVTLPALRNIQGALDKLDLDIPIKGVVPLNADVLSNGGSSVPSAGLFRSDIKSLMDSLVNFLAKHDAPFVVNIYPFLSLHQDQNFPHEFAFFDGANSAAIHDLNGNTYTNVFDASYDLLVAALARNGFPDMKIIVGEIGWPTDGEPNATPANAQRFNQGLLRHVTGGRGTPLRPNQELDVYLFSLTDEDQKSVLPGNFERHWGVYTYDGRTKYQLSDVMGTSLVKNVSGDVEYLPWRWCVLNPEGDMSKLPKNMDYACSHGDCTALVYGGSCNNIGAEGNASYAFNSYYQIYNQEDESCVFDGLGMITTANPSSGGCEFPVQLNPLASSSSPSTATLLSSESTRIGQSMLLVAFFVVAQVVLDIDKILVGQSGPRIN